MNGEHPGCISLSTMAQRPQGVTLPPLHGLGVNAREDPALVLFSSGTTGMPKAVLLTHNSVVFGLEIL